ncbi:MAG: ABC transporter permease [Acidobacteriota bacterium]
MRFAHLVWRNLLRKKARTLFTLLSIAIAFILFAHLSAIGQAFSLGVEVAGADRLMVIHKVSLIQPLPVSYGARLKNIPGVADATHATWFGGKYQDEHEGRFGIFPVVPEEYLRTYPEFVLPEEQKIDWFADRTGAVVGRQTADDFGWKVGDRIPIQGTIFRRTGGNDTWEFTIDGIYHGAKQGVDETLFLIHYDSFNESREALAGKDLVGWYIVRVEDPEHAAEIADRIDVEFANSAAETETSTEKAFVQGFANQIGNIGAILRAVMTAVFFTILMVAGTTMAQSVRERTSELAVLKTLGFSDGRILWFVLQESLLIAGLGGGLGLGLGWLMVQGGDPTGGYLPLFAMPASHVGLGVALIVLLGLTSGLMPALQAMRLRIVTALRST